MVYLIETYWLWCLLALVLGLVVGWLTWSRAPNDGSWLPGWLKWAALLWLAGLVVALFRWFGGRSGLYLEMALLFFVAYLVGCVAGAWVRSLLSANEQPAVSPAVSPVAPVPMAAVAPGDDDHPGTKPAGLAEARGGKADDLKRIKGIGRQNEARLHGLGIWHFDQIAAWTPANVEWAGAFLAFPGRIDREGWVDQARQLAQGLETEFSKRVAEGLVEASRDDGTKGQGNVAKAD